MVVMVVKVAMMVMMDGDKSLHNIGLAATVGHGSSELAMCCMMMVYGDSDGDSGKWQGGGGGGSTGNGRRVVPPGGLTVPLAVVAIVW